MISPEHQKSQPSTPPSGAGGLSFFTTESAEFQGFNLITVKSNALKKRADITVYKPKRNTHLSGVIILLHGVYGSHWSWAAQGKAHETVQALIDDKIIKPMLLVMPSDGLFADGSGYLPHKTENYEKWIVEDVIQVIKEQFAEIDNQTPFFISGLSMGGFGAMRLAAKYPEKFKAFSGLSSITLFEQMKLFVSDFNDLQEKVLEKDSIIDWLKINKTKLPPFRFDCGSEDILIEHNQLLHKELEAEKIPHIYEEYIGGHTWSYWSEHIKKSFIFFNQFL